MYTNITRGSAVTEHNNSCHLKLTAKLVLGHTRVDNDKLQNSRLWQWQSRAVKLSSYVMIAIRR